MIESVGRRLVEAIAHQDAAAIEACFAADVQFRALTPKGLRERAGADEAASLIARWFGDSAELDLVDSHSVEVGDRLRIAYRFQGVEDGREFVVEQHLYCTIAGDRIHRADLLCSGFRPRSSDTSIS